MKSRDQVLFLHLASYARWDQAEMYPINLFRSFGPDLAPQAFDDKDPPRRPYTGDTPDVRFWMNKADKEWGRWLFVRHKSKAHVYTGVTQWMDLDKEPMKSRGDYHSMYLTVKTKQPNRVIEFWRSACIGLQPFHAFLDTELNYNRRAHEVAPDGQVKNKNTGWYLQRIPGFFAYNYFGTVYLRRWGAKVENLPASLTAPDTNGLFVFAPSCLDLEGRRSDVYSPEDLAIIQTLGPEWFHLPDRPDRVHAPSLDEFLAATPPPPATE
jgi:hypothetical protein